MVPNWAEQLQKCLQVHRFEHENNWSAAKNGSCLVGWEQTEEEKDSFGSHQKWRLSIKLIGAKLSINLFLVSKQMEVATI